MIRKREKNRRKGKKNKEKMEEFFQFDIVSLWGRVG